MSEKGINTKCSSFVGFGAVRGVHEEEREATVREHETGGMGGDGGGAFDVCPHQ